VVNARIQDLSYSGAQCVQAARQLLGSSAGQPQLACYLLHVALECLLKVRIMRIRGTVTLEALRKAIREEDFDRLFSGREGHRLDLLAENASLKRVLTSNRAQNLLDGPTWARMCSGLRPYSLRYGVERASRQMAEQELTLGESLAKILSADT